MSNHIETNLEALIKVLTQSGIIVLKQGTTKEAAKSVLNNALAAAKAEIPDDITVSGVDIPVFDLVEVIEPLILRGISELIDALSPSTVEIVMEDDVKVVWNIT